MRKTLGVSVLALALCGSAFAGDIPNPPAPVATNYTQLTAGEIPGPPYATQSSDDPITDGLAVAALNVLDSLLALF